MTMTSFWSQTQGRDVLQGDWLRGCKVPEFRIDENGELLDQFELNVADLIVVTQSCDLNQDRAQFVAMCPIKSIEGFDATQPAPLGKRYWEEARKGRREGLHLLSSPTPSGDYRQTLVVDFRLIVSLPIAYIRFHANSLGFRYRLESPYLEHFSQAFARFFMRVGLPSEIPAFK